MSECVCGCDEFVDKKVKERTHGLTLGLLFFFFLLRNVFYLASKDRLSIELICAAVAMVILTRKVLEVISSGPLPNECCPDLLFFLPLLNSCFLWCQTRGERSDTMATPVVRRCGAVSDRGYLPEAVPVAGGGRRAERPCRGAAAQERGSGVQPASGSRGARLHRATETRQREIS